MTGLSRRPNYEELAQLVSTDPTRLRLPDRFATELANSFEYGSIQRDGLLKLEEMNMRMAEKAEKDAAIQRIAQNNDVPLSTLRAILEGAHGASVAAGMASDHLSDVDTSSAASFHSANEAAAEEARAVTLRTSFFGTSASIDDMLSGTGVARMLIPETVRGRPTGAFIPHSTMPLGYASGAASSSGYNVRGSFSSPFVDPASEAGRALASHRTSRQPAGPTLRIYGTRTEGPMDMPMDVDGLRTEGPAPPTMRTEGRMRREPRMPPPARPSPLLFDASGTPIPLQLAFDHPPAMVLAALPAHSARAMAALPAPVMTAARSAGEAGMASDTLEKDLEDMIDSEELPKKATKADKKKPNLKKKAISPGKFSKKALTKKIVQGVVVAA